MTQDSRQLNELLDRYLSKYVPMQTSAQLQQTQPQQPTQTQQPSSALNQTSSSTATTVDPKYVTHLSSPGYKPSATSAVNPSSSSATQWNLAPITYPSSSNPSSTSVAPAAASTISFTPSTTQSLQQTTQPASVDNTLIDIQTQIDQLSKKLHRVPETVLPTSTVSTQPIQPTLQPVPRPSSASHPTQQPQLHMHELDQSMHHAPSQPQPQPQQTMQQPPSAYTISLPYQTFDAQQAQRNSIAASIVAFSPSKPSQPDSTSSIPIPSSYQIPSGPPTSSPANLRAQISTLQSQLTKQTNKVSEKEFVIQTLTREVNALKAKVATMKSTFDQHSSLQHEHQVLKLSLSRSEKIRKEQLGYIQILHQQIVFLQNSNQQILEQSPQKQQQHQQQQFPMGLASPTQQQLQQQIAFAQSASIPINFDALSADGVSISHIDPAGSITTQPLSNFSPQRASIPSRAMRTETNVAEDNAALAEAAEMGTRLMQQAARPSSAPHQTPISPRLNYSLPPGTIIPPPVHSRGSFSHPAQPFSTIPIVQPAAAPVAVQRNEEKETASVIEEEEPSEPTSPGLTPRKSVPTAVRHTIASTLRKQSNTNKKSVSTFGTGHGIFNSKPVPSSTTKARPATSRSHKPTKAALAASAARPKSVNLLHAKDI